MSMTRYCIILCNCDGNLWMDDNLRLHVSVQWNEQLMPILETLYNASRRTSNQIYMLLIILLILSQDSSFNASIHKLVRIAPAIPCYSSSRWIYLFTYWSCLYRYFQMFHGTKNAFSITHRLVLCWL